MVASPGSKRPSIRLSHQIAGPFGNGTGSQEFEAPIGWSYVQLMEQEQSKPAGNRERSQAFTSRFFIKPPPESPELRSWRCSFLEWASSKARLRVQSDLGEDHRLGSRPQQ